MYCIVKNPHPHPSCPITHMIVLHDASVKASGYPVVVVGLQSFEQAARFKVLLGFEREEETEMERSRR